MRVRFGLASALIVGWASLGMAQVPYQQAFPSVLDAAPPPASSLVPKVPDVNPLGTPLPNPQANPLTAAPSVLPTDTLVPDNGYLQVNPNGRTSLCDTDNRRPERLWVIGAYFLGVTEDLGPVERKETHGAHLGAGLWFDDYRTLGVDLSFLTTHDTYSDYANTPAGTILINAPVTISTGDINLRGHILTHGRNRLDALVGYRMMHLSERYNTFGAGAPLLSRSNNIVHAFQVGAVGDYHFGPYFGELAFKLGVGSNAQRTTLNGVTARDTKVAVIPEINFRMGYLLGSGTRLFVGYNLIYLSAAARPNGFTPTNFMMNSVQAGLEFTY